MTNFSTVDFCVIGGGLAGLTAALRASELGLKCLVLEQSHDERYLCNSRVTSGVFHVARNSVTTPAATLEALLLKLAANGSNEELLRSLAHDSLRAVRWLQGQGVRFMKISSFPFQDFVLAPPATHRGGPFDVLRRGGDVLLRLLEGRLAEAGVPLLRGWRARDLLMSGGQCVGVHVDNADVTVQVNAKHTVIADGGFQANPRLLERAAIVSDPRNILQRNARSSMGDGLIMAEAAGALLTDLRGFYGHVMSADALHDDRLWPYPWLDPLVTSGVVVGQNGLRFTDEGRGGVRVANEIAKRPLEDRCFVVFDDAIWSGPGASYISPPNPNLLRKGAALIKADSLSELAKVCEIDVNSFLTEIESYNNWIASPKKVDLVPPRTVSVVTPMRIKSPPFFAAPMVAGITYTMGGVAIDEWSRACRPEGGFVPGLYAIGGASGGIEGGPNAVYVGGLVKATVTAIRAAECASGKCT